MEDMERGLQEMALAQRQPEALRRPGGEDVQAERRAPERPRGDAGHHGYHPARAPGRGRALPDGWPCVGGRSADHFLNPRYMASDHKGLAISGVRSALQSETFFRMK